MLRRCSLGSYSGISEHVGGRRPGAKFTLDATGNITGGNDVCGFSGTMTPRKSGNVFDWTLRSAGASVCIFGRGPVTGTMYYDEATRQLHGFAPYAARMDLFYLIGTK